MLNIYIIYIYIIRYPWSYWASAYAHRNVVALSRQVRLTVEGQRFADTSRVDVADKNPLFAPSPRCKRTARNRQARVLDLNPVVTWTQYVTDSETPAMDMRGDWWRYWVSNRGNTFDIVCGTFPFVFTPVVDEIYDCLADTYSEKIILIHLL